MAVLGRILFSSQERLDLQDLLSIDSFAAGDWKFFMKSLVGSDRPYVLRGFDVIDPRGMINQSALEIRVADSIVFYPTSDAGAFFHGLEEGNENATPLVPELRRSATNYVYLVLNTFDTARDARAIWDPDKEGGDGGEFSEDINTETVLKADVDVSIGSFPNDTIPICIVTVDAGGLIVSIEDARDMMFRLGTGGLTPDPLSRYNWRDLPNSTYSRTELPTTVDASSAANESPFQGADKNIYSLKEWMDSVMTKLAELGGSTYWYEDISMYSLLSLWTDALGTTLKTKGQWSHDTSTAGLLAWTEDIHIQSVIGPRDIIVREDTQTLQNEQVLYIEYIREQPINGSGYQVTFQTGANAEFVNGAVAAFSNVTKGDYIKKDTDPNSAWLRIEEMYLDSNGGGGVAAVSADAKSVRLSEDYAGSASTSPAVYTKGEFAAGETLVADRSDPVLATAGGDMYWLAMRSDTIMAVSDITPAIIEGDITDADGETAKFTATGAHNLRDGEQITIAGSTNYDGTYAVEVVDSTTFYIDTTDTSNETGVDAFYAVATTVARDNGYSYPLESASHQFETGQTIIVDDTTDYDAGHEVFVGPTDNDKFSFPITPTSPPTLPPAFSAPPNGTATLARLNVRSESGIEKLVQGEATADPTALMQFVGQANPAQNTPIYLTPAGYNAIHGYENYNSLVSDNLTERVSKLTAMMADRIQDRGIELIGNVTFANAAGVVSWASPLTMQQPASDPQVLPGPGSVSLGTNQVAVVEIDRNGAGTLSISAIPFTTSYLLEENKFILFYRFNTTDVYAWDGNVIKSNGAYTISNVEDSQSKNIKFVNVNNFYLSTTDTIQFHTLNDMDLIIHGSANNNVIDTSAINGFTLLDGESAWVRIDREAAKNINNVQSTDVPDTVANGSLYVTTSTSVPKDQDVFVLFARVGDNVFMFHTGELSGTNVYEEELRITNTPAPGPPDADNESPPVSAGANLQIPLDSRGGDAAQTYLVGAGFLEVYLNGQVLRLDEDWTEVGAPGTASGSIDIQQDLVDGDVLVFRIDTEGGILAAATGSGGNNLQQAYNLNANVTTNGVDPITISTPNSSTPLVVNKGPGANDKAAEFNGNIKVTGVIDPTGMVFDRQASNPLQPTDYGLWVDMGSPAGDLIFARGADAPLNISDAVANPVGAAVTLTNNTGSTMNIGDVVALHTVAGEIILANAGTIATSQCVPGVVSEEILDGESGKIQVVGEAVVNAPVALTIGARVYVSTSAGQATSTAPTALNQVVYLLGQATDVNKVILTPHLEYINE